MGDKFTTASALEECAILACAREQTECAALLLGASAALRSAIGSPVDPGERAEQERLIIQIQADLNADKFLQQWQEGKNMTSEYALQYALKNLAS